VARRRRRRPRFAARRRRRRHMAYREQHPGVWPDFLLCSSPVTHMPEEALHSGMIMGEPEPGAVGCGRGGARACHAHRQVSARCCRTRTWRHGTRFH
jgi:hypothetical protein